MADSENNLDIDDVESHLHDIEDLLDHLNAAGNPDERESDPESADAPDPDEARILLGHRLLSLEIPYLSYILEAIAEEDRRTLWAMIAPLRQQAILAELTEQTRSGLLETPLPASQRNMPAVFELQSGRLRQITINSRDELVRARPIWVDLVTPTDVERDLVEDVFGLSLPRPDEHTDLEASARFYVEEEGEIYLHSDFLLDKEDESRNVPVTFILHRNILFSIRNVELPVFRLQRLRARTQVGLVSDCLDVLLGLYAADVEYSADALEDVYAALEAVGKRVLNTGMTDDQAARVLSEIAGEEDLNGRIRRNVLDTRRAISFLMRGRMLSASQIADSQQLLRDIESLDGHTAFLFDKINFLMDATVGFININQNKTIRIFSVASVALLPPTLIASVYGMNFRQMPELEWQFGYPFSLLLMAFSVVLPFWWFHRKGWLK